MVDTELILEPSGIRIVVDTSQTILDAIREAGHYVPSDCGGRGTCGKCKVVVKPIPDPSTADLEQLSISEIRDGTRLACQHQVGNAKRVGIPSQDMGAQILTDSLMSERLVADLGDTNDVGVAIDIGTTTIVCYFMNMGTGIQLGQKSAINPQIVHGEDVMSRLSYAIENPEGSTELQEQIWSKVEELIDSFLDEKGIDPRNITAGSVVGNTAMQHFALGYEVQPLAMAPYTPHKKESTLVRGTEIGLTRFLNVSIYFSPVVAGFVGGDALAFMLSRRMEDYSGVSLGIDVGTNGEMILSKHGEIFCCSAAAGPAFEGARIKDGMRAQKGAIEYANIRDAQSTPDLGVIGNVSPEGICGSGVLDIVAELRSIGQIDDTGRIHEGPRVEEHPKHGRVYRVADLGERNARREIILTQNDVRQVQLAKAAIRAGTEILLSKAGLKSSNIDAVFLAGAFGNYMRPESALSIGLLPPVSANRVIPVGNAAGAGAKRILVSSEERKRIENIAETANYIELASAEDFNSLFAICTRLIPELVELDAKEGK
ncbi:DUF4445 domain-containing protein [Candidatus Thorarchaeota archaeon]|nr:MAG: DUF4445 domain-containing protein [Candidatus Thorarchaeota archaeon]